MTDFINLHLLPSHDPLSRFVFSCLTEYILLPPPALAV